MSGFDRLPPLWTWPAIWAADFYWWARRKVEHARWLAGIACHARQGERAEREVQRQVAPQEDH